MLKQGLTSEIKWFAVLFIIVTIIGYKLGYPAESLLIFSLGYVVSLYIRIYKLEQWVGSIRQSGPQVHDFTGSWGDISDEVTRLYSSYQRDKTRLQAMVTRIQNMTSAMEDGVVLIDKDANIEWWNGAAQALFNFQEVDQGHRIENIIRHPKFVYYFESHDYTSPLVLEGLRHEYQFLEFRIQPFGEGERLLIIRDITRIQKLEQMRKDFVGNVSHELRTPLTVIRGYIETLVDMPNLPAPLEKALQQMQQQGLRMTNLINDLITLSRLETDGVDPNEDWVNIPQLIDNIISEASSIPTDKKHTVERSGLEQLYIKGSEMQLHSAFSNLILNALKYAYGDCRVEVKIELFGNECLVSIKDDGPGIDSKHLPRLTERFYRVDAGRSSDMGGTGLGLAIVKHVLIRHEAALKIRSRLGKGSTFTCHFPKSRVKTIEQRKQSEALITPKL